MLTYEVQNRVASIILNRPDKRNALNAEMVEQLTKAFKKAAADKAAKVIKLSANGEVFSAGADLESIRHLQHASFEENREDSRKLADLFQFIDRCPKPVISAVHGHAIAGGCGLQALTDISVASESAKLGYTEVRIGFVPAIVSKFLVNKVGETQARRLLLGGKLVSAKEAARIGLVTEAVADEDFEATVDHWVETLVERCSGEALRQTKELIRTIRDLDSKESIDYAVLLNAEARGTEDCQKGITAFLNKEKIRW